MKTVTYEHSGPPTYQTLNAAYYKIVWGYTEPDTIRYSMATHAKLNLGQFNNAKVVVDPTLPDNEVIICYQEYPEYFRQHKQAYQVRITLEQGHVSD